MQFGFVLWFNRATINLIFSITINIRKVVIRYFDTDE
jgi:hypothetical protein